MIEVHYAPTMNGHKVALMLEEIELPYKLIHYRILEGDHLTPEYRAINPNFKIPTIVDLAPADGGAPLAVFETGAILFYLGEKTGRFIPNDFRRREEARQWLTWQVAGLGPMHGQANHFMRYAPAGQDYAIERYSRESRRLVAVLEHRLETVDYLAGEYSIADMASWAFIRVMHTIDIDIAEFPAIQAWSDRIARRPAAIRLLTNPATATPDGILQKRMTLTDAQWSSVFGDRLHAAVRMR